jgi:hypothetical protein
MKSKYKLLLIILLLISFLAGYKLNNKSNDLILLNNKLLEANEKIENLQSQVDNQTSLIESLEEDKKELGEVTLAKENEELDRWNYEINFINANQDRMSLTYFVEESGDNAQVVNIIGNNFTKHGEDYSSERIEIKGTGENEYVKFIIFGDVYDFSLYSLNYLDSDFEKAQRVLKKNLGDISNTEVMVETILPEGLPGELISWKDAEGNLYEEYLSYDGLGASGRIRISSR